MSVRPITTYIQAEPALTPLLRRLAELSYLQSLFNQAVPRAMLKLGQVGSFRDGTLMIFAENGAAAAKLKQVLPDMTEKISNLIKQRIEIRVSVQVDPLEPKTQRTRHKPALSRQALESLNKLADDLPPSPLKDEVALLVIRQARDK